MVGSGSALMEHVFQSSQTAIICLKERLVDRVHDIIRMRGKHGGRSNEYNFKSSARDGTIIEWATL